MTIQKFRRMLACVVGASAFSLAQATCADTGQIIDAHTGKPLAGVHVIAAWDADRPGGIGSSQVCFQIDATQTDESGRFALPPLSSSVNPLLSDRRRTLVYYKRGYRAPESTARSDAAHVAMIPDAGTGLDRLKYIAGTIGGARCGPLEQHRKALRPYARAVFEEATRLARNKEELRWLNHILHWVDDLELGATRALENYVLRRRKWALQ